MCWRISLDWGRIIDITLKYPGTIAEILVLENKSDHCSKPSGEGA